MVRFLTDENIAPIVVTALRNQKFEVIDTKEQHWAGKSDHFLITQAIKLHAIIITRDNDFRDPMLSGKHHPGIILLQYYEQRSTRIITHLLDQLTPSFLELLHGKITIISEETIEQL